MPGQLMNYGSTWGLNLLVGNLALKSEVECCVLCVVVNKPLNGYILC